MRDHDYIEASLFLKEYFGTTTHQNVEIRALPNERGAGRAAPLFTREPLDIEMHCRRWDEIGRAVYFGTATRLLGHGSGKREDLAELPGLWADIDSSKLGLDKGLVAHTIGSDLFMPPSVIIDSGYGIHGHWLLREALDIRIELSGAAELEADILAALKQLAGVVAGDIAVCDLARIMRLPATHNTKQGELVACHVLEASWVRYEYEEVLDWLLWQRPVLEASSAAKRHPRPAESDAFLRYAQTAGIKPPIDVGARLAAMEYLGTGDQSVHQTQLHVSASLVMHGAGEEAIVGLLLAATREAVGLAGEHWNWRREEKNLRAMTLSARAKFGERAPAEEPAAEVEEEADEKVVNFAAQKRTRGRPKKDPADPAQRAKDSLIARCGDAVIKWWQEERGKLALVDGIPYTYKTGIWIPWTAGDQHILKCSIQGILAAGKIDPKTQILNAIARYVLERPDLTVENVGWNAAGSIVLLDATLIPGPDGNWVRVPHSSDHWATARVAVRAADMSQGCPRWLAFLDGCFSDRTGEEAVAVIACLQEWFGAAMVHGKARELRKALWLHGESRTGKTRVLEVLRLLVGEPTSALKLKGFGTHFGPSAVLGKRGWIADDAVGSNDEVNDAEFKVAVTGELFTADQKNNPHATGRLDIPIAFSSNTLPKVKDQSDGVFNRSILIPMHVVRPEEETAGKTLIEDQVRAGELAGVFRWALDGWGRLQARGRFLVPSSMREAGDAFKDANNPALAWAKIALKADPDFMVDRRDLYTSFKGWYAAEYGADAKPLSQKYLINALRQGLGVGHATKIRHGYRLMVGVRMTDEGLTFREECPRPPGGGDIGSGCMMEMVNKPSGAS